MFFFRRNRKIHPDSHLLTREYEGRRSGTLLKIKTFYDAEAVVTGYVPGKGRNKGVAGALKCKMASGKVGRRTMTKASLVDPYL
jgi:ATP-dependent DNA ligase